MSSEAGLSLLVFLFIYDTSSDKETHQLEANWLKVNRLIVYAVQIYGMEADGVELPQGPALSSILKHCYCR